MNLGGFDLEGPFDDPEQLRDEPGVYVVLGIRSGNAGDILDVGETGWNFPSGQGLRRRLKSHNRRWCWEEHKVNGTIKFAVLYEKDGEKRLRIEEALRRFYKPPCGTDPWQLTQ